MQWSFLLYFSQGHTLDLAIKYLHKFQSGFCSQHSTETDLINVLNDRSLNTDSGKILVLVLLDLSAAFDTINPRILLSRLETWV